jgi:hypothetical protein
MNTKHILELGVHGGSTVLSLVSPDYKDIGVLTSVDIENTSFRLHTVVGSFDNCLTILRKNT